MDLNEQGQRTSQCLPRILPDFSLEITAETGLPSSRKGKACRQPKPARHPQRAAFPRVHVVWRHPHNMGPYTSLEYICNETSTALWYHTPVSALHYVLLFCQPPTRTQTWFTTLSRETPVRSEDTTPPGRYAFPHQHVVRMAIQSSVIRGRERGEKNKRDTGKKRQKVIWHKSCHLLITLWKTLSLMRYMFLLPSFR